MLTVALQSPLTILERFAFAEEAGALAPAERARAPYLPPSQRASAVPPEKTPSSTHKTVPVAAGLVSHETLSPEAANLVLVLQDSHSEVGAKIGALNRLLTYDVVGINVLMQAATDAGPVPGILLNLSRHSDPELASKARALLDRGGGLNAIVVRDLSSPNQLTQANAKAVVQLMDSAQADQLLEPLPAAERKTLVPPPTDQPLPTGSRGGDRYYVKATWNPKVVSVVGCLTTFYNGFFFRIGRLLTKEG